MKIASANLQMASSHTSLQHHETSESLKIWTGQRRPELIEDNRQGRFRQTGSVSISDAGKAAQSADSIREDQDAAVDNDPGLKLIRSMLELMTGHKMQVFDARKLQAHTEHAASPPSPENASNPPRAPCFSAEYNYHESYAEFEQTSFSASGTVKTADGQEISFKVELTMTRSYYEESNINLRFGDAKRKIDPLTLNFSGNAAQLTDQKFSFDLNADGQSENISNLAPGSGFLAFDRNQDGKINDGRELFGPTTGDGFAELAQLDDDKNGWIDENDAAFSRLEIWTRDSSGNDQHQSLAAAGVGAISLSRINTPFDLKTSSNETLGKIVSSGIYLKESGEAGTIQQIDLTA
jgi:hypothetical protein